jgi:ankyrin repeat protein
LAEYNSKYGLNEHANSHKESTARINNWMREAKERRLSQTLEKKLAENKDSYQEIVVLEEERDIIKDYYSYGWETEHIMPERFDPIDILKHLSDFNDVQFDLKDEFGRTPLHYAACVGAFSCTTLLIEKNVDINAVDTDNVSFACNNEACID